MSYGLKTPIFSSTERNQGIILTKKRTERRCYSLLDFISRGSFQIVYDTTRIKKAYGTRDYSFYYKDGASINFVTAEQLYLNDIYQNKRDYTQEKLNRRFDESVIRKNQNYALEVKDVDFEGVNFSTRDRYIKIIDHVFVGGFVGTGLPHLNYEFPYVKKIGVILPSLTYGDITDYYPNDDTWLFNVEGNRFTAGHKNGITAQREVFNAPFQAYHKAINEFTSFGSDCLIVDLSDLF